MTTGRLSIYNSALRSLGCRELASLSENRESRRVLDGIWNDGFVDKILEQAFWKFSIRSQMITYDTNIDPEFGLRYAFAQPEDYVRPYSICSDEDFNNPIIRYVDEAGYWYCDYDTIYVQFVSDDEDYGYDYTKWPESVNTYAHLDLAHAACIRLTQSESKKQSIGKDRDKALIDARSKDAMKNPVKFQHLGTWSNARMANRLGNIRTTLSST